MLPIENDMKRPNDFTGCPGVLNISMGCLIFLYTTMGFFGFARFGNEINGSITLNLPENDPLSLSIQWMMSTALLCSMGILFQIGMSGLWKKIVHLFPDDKHNIGKIGVRFTAFVIVVLMVLVIPNLGVFISLMGSIGITTSFMIPALINTAYLHPNYGRFKWRLWKNILILIYAVFISTVGFYFSILDVVKLYK